MTPEEIVSGLVKNYPSLGLTGRVDKEHAVVELPVGKIYDLAKAIKESPEFAFDFLMDLTAVDWFEKRTPRFDVVYHFYSVEHNHRLRVKSVVNDGQSVPTVTKLWAIADWFEREVWDLYGIKFDGHPNLKRILTYDEFKGHPLRKDYPYNKIQPLIPETWPVRNLQIHMKEGEKIHMP